MAAALVQKKGSAEFSGVTAYTVTFDDTVIAGSHIVVCASGFGSGTHEISSVADNKLNGNYDLAEVSPRIFTNQIIVYQHYKNFIATGGGSFQVTVTWNETVAGCAGIFEYTGIATSPTVTTATATSTSPTILSGSVAPAAASLYVACCSFSALTTALPVGGGYTSQLALDINNDTQALAVADLLSASGAQECTWTQDANDLYTSINVAYAEGAASLTTSPEAIGWETKMTKSVTLSPGELKLSGLDLKAANDTVYRSIILDLKDFGSFRALFTTDRVGNTTTGTCKLSLEVLANDLSTVIQTFDLLTDINVTEDRAEQVSWGAGINAGRDGVGDLGTLIDFIRGSISYARLLVTVVAQSDAATSNLGNVYLFMS